MNRLRVVLDTNVIFSALYSDTGASYQLLMLLQQGQIVPCLSVVLALEYEEVLLDHLDDFEQTGEAVRDIMDYLCAVSVRQAVFYLWRPFLRDPNDDMVLELAIASGARLVVTHNKKHFDGAEQFGIEAVSPSELLKRLRRKI